MIVCYCDSLNDFLNHLNCENIIHVHKYTSTSDAEKFEMLKFAIQSAQRKKPVRIYSRLHLGSSYQLVMECYPLE